MAGSTQEPLLIGPPPIVLLRTEELFCTVDFSRVQHSEETTTANPTVLRKKVEEEIQKQDKKFRIKAIIKDYRSPDRLRILYRIEEELQNIKSTATTTAV